jgi:NADH:ubiquinone oxidoreductase subunit 2 (subunit N)
VGLAAVLIVFSAVSLYYYLNVIVEIWFKPISRQTIAKSPGAESNAAMRMLSIFAVVAALLIGIVGPRFALQLDYTQAQEQELRLPTAELSVSPSGRVTSQSE